MGNRVFCPYLRCLTISFPCSLSYFLCRIITIIIIIIMRSKFINSTTDAVEGRIVLGMSRFMSDIKQPSLPTLIILFLCLCVLRALSTLFHSIISPENSPLSHSVLPVLFLTYWSFSTIYLFKKVSLSPDIILCG